MAGYDPCIEKYAEVYYNRADVQKALHANTTGIPYKWTACSEVLNRNWNDTDVSILPLYRELIAHGVRVWVFSGDVDSVVPVTATRFALAELRLTTKIPWYPWYVKKQNRTPSRLSSMFSGTLDKCATCSKTVYPLEKVTLEGECYHKNCFRCAHAGCPLTHSNYVALDGVLYCRVHFAQLFMEKGNYSHVLKSAHKRNGSSPPSEPIEVVEEPSQSAAEAPQDPPEETS